ncbi:MAG: undecaprenyldiphospho-muramoylpentapeptide beta-N-acetylglucosaminyltransferase [Deltaproteobacteria bacterium]|nr:undecaprenyldiphospho-muramoylpentapeptide beta-N-acetylglucosaminyltransferase [Deltaproteobacteria bacterium]
MRVLITGGGTGGHVFPAVAIAEALERRMPDVTLAFAGMATGMEARIVAGLGRRFFPIAAAPFKGRRMLDRVRAVPTLVCAVRAASRVLTEFAPDAVVGTGGYVSAPLMGAAAWRRLPTLIHEQNSIPGLTNRLLGRVVRRVCTTYPQSNHFFPPRKVLRTGMPLRHAIVERLRTRVQPPGPPWTIFVMGGSQGARRVNELVIGALAGLGRSGVPCQVIHQIGSSIDTATVERAYRDAGIAAEVYHFIDEIEAVYARAHLVIGRAGASSVAEIALAGLPALLIPYPHAADNHQEENARAVVASGGALLLREAETNSAQLLATCLAVLQDPARLAAMSAAMHALATPHAAEQIVDAVVELVQNV